MRKAISLFLAASVLCLSTSAMAAAPTISGNVGGSLTNGDSGTRNNVVAFGNAEDAANMPGFRPGDTIIFTVGSLTVGDEVTLITYKNGDTPSNSTVQYINQYTAEAATQAIRYTIRSGLTQGIYKLEINGGGTVSNFYYKVGDATVLALHNADRDGNSHGTFSSGYGNPYIIKQAENGTWSVGFVGKVTVGSGEITLGDIGANPGFAIKEGETIKKYGYGVDGNKAVSTLQETTQYEVSGSYSFIYGLTMYNVTDGHETSITAEAVLDADE